MSSMRDYVDEEDKVLGQATKERIEAEGLICRVSFIVLRNSENRLLLQQRSSNKRFYPLFWSGAAAGHLIAGESYEEGAVRELLEEMTIETPLDYLGKFYSADDREMVGVFVGTYDGTYDFEPMEVAQVKTFSLEEIAHRPDDMKITTYVERSLPLLQERSD